MKLTTLSRGFAAMQIAALMFSMGGAAFPLVANATVIPEGQIEICHHDQDGKATHPFVNQTDWNNQQDHGGDFIIGENDKTENDCKDKEHHDDGGTIKIVKLIDADGNPDTTNDQTSGGEGWQFTVGDSAPVSTDSSGTVEVKHVKGSPDVTEVANDKYTLLSSNCVLKSHDHQDGEDAIVQLDQVRGDEDNQNDNQDKHHHGEKGVKSDDGDHITCTFINTPVPTTLKVHIFKYLDNGDTVTQVPDNSTAPAFPMHASWNAVNIGASSGDYVLGNNHGGATLKYAADTSPMSVPADYSTNEIADGTVVVPTNSETCPAGKYRLEGYKVGDSVPAAEAATITTSVPTFSGLNADKYVIVVNKACSVTPPVENTCVAPTGGAELPDITPGPSSSGGELSLQTILDNAGYSLNAVTDQQNFQEWDGTNNTIHFDVTYMKKYAAHAHTFGYYVNGSTTFNPLFRDGNDPTYPAAPIKSVGGDVAFDVPNVNNVVFAIGDWDGATERYFTTTNSLNAGNLQHTVVFNPVTNEYVIAFEDLSLGDHDYNDLVVKLNVKGCENPNTATIVATKIVCNNESDLPNWGNGDGGNITATTASDFLAKHETCHLQSDWKFETAPAGTANPGDNQEVGGGAWTASGLTNGSGVVNITVPVPAGESPYVWAREELKSGYVPFSSSTSAPRNDVSAEMYCNVDHLNYDNYDRVDNLVAGNTYYCVAFNAPAQQCNAEASQDVVSDTSATFSGNDGSGPAVAVTPTDVTNSAWTNILGATWIWSIPAILDGTADNTETFTKTFNIVGTPTGASLDIAADNFYSVSVNGHDIDLGAGNATDNNFTASANYGVPASDLLSGTNTITVVGKNEGVPADTGEAGAHQNPAGVLFKLHVTNNECTQPPVDVCPNIDGNQAQVPQGYHLNSDNFCVPNENTGTLTIVKDTTGGNGIFSFGVTGQDNVNVETTEGSGSQDIQLNVGAYDVTENVPEGWNLNSVGCIYDNESIGNSIPNGEHIVLENGDHVTCTFHDTKQGEGSGADVTLSKVVDDTSSQIDNATSANRGDTLVYTLTAHNNGPDTATNVVVNDALPEGVHWVSNDLPSVGSYDHETGIWTIGSLASGVDATLSITVTVDNGTGGQEPASGTITNTASVTSDNDPNSDNNSGSASFTVNVPEPTGPTGGGGGSFSTSSFFRPQGQVLGESCGLYMDKHIKFGSKKNDIDQVKKLQTFLNKWMGTNLPITGFYGPATLAAVHAFQKKYGDEILKPWGLNATTGLVYLSTLREINLLECPALSLELPPLVPWSNNPGAQ